MIDLRPPIHSRSTDADPSRIKALGRVCLGDLETSRGDQDDRRASAETLGRWAFVDRDRRAWETVQVLVWRLMRRERFRPTHPADVAVLDALFAIEAQSVALPSPPRVASADEFCDQLDRDIDAVFAEGRFDTSALNAFSRRDWQFVMSNFIPSVWDFTRLVALASVQLPLTLAVPLYENLYSEGGGGDRSQTHRASFVQLMSALGVDLPDLDEHPFDELEVLDEILPESVAELNVWCRMLWSRHPGGSLGALYVVERGVPGYYTPLERHLRQFGLGDGDLGYMTHHQELDVDHASEWRQLVRALIARHPEERERVYHGALLSASWDVLAWRAIMESRQRRDAGEHVSGVRACL